MPRLIRRRPLAERVKSYLNPADFLLWLSEELDSSDWDQWQKDWATPIGVGLNLIFLIARANSANSARRADDVFSDDEGYSWWSWLVCAIQVVVFYHYLYPVIGSFHCSPPINTLLPERSIYLLPPASLQAVRSASGCCA